MPAGGYGNPLERSKDAVEEDLRGYISKEFAKKHYGLEG